MNESYRKNSIFSVSASWLGRWLGRMGQLEWRDTHETTCLNLLYHPEFVYQILSQSDEIKYGFQEIVFKLWLLTHRKGEKRQVLFKLI